MEQQSISVTLADRSRVDRDQLKIEQKDYRPNTGQMTKAGMVNLIGRMIYGGDGWSEDADCGMDADGNVSTGIYVYPSDPGLAYQIRATYGTIGPGIIEQVDQEEMVTLSNEDETSTRYPVMAMVSIIPQGDLYDEKGAIVPLPAITFDQDRIRLARKVYGTLKVTYLVNRHAYDLVIPCRDLAATHENFYSSVVYAWGSNCGAWLRVDPPAGAEEYATDESACGWGEVGDTISGGHDDHNRPKTAGADRKIVINYCPDEVITDNTYEHVEY